MKNTNVIAIARNNKVFTTSLICYLLFLAVVLIESNNAFAIKQITIATGVGALAVYGVVRLVKALLCTKVTPLSFELIKTYLKKEEFSFKENKSGLDFSFDGFPVPFNLSYSDESKKLVINLIMVLGNAKDRTREVASRASLSLMSKLPFVRIYFKEDINLNEKEPSLAIAFEVDTQVYSFEEFKSSFAKYVKSIIDAQQGFMTEGDEISKSMKEAESKTKKVGFYSPMKEKIDNFIKQHPTATEDEVSKYIDSIR